MDMIHKGGVKLFFLLATFVSPPSFDVAFVCSYCGKTHNVKFTIVAVFKCAVQWCEVHSIAVQYPHTFTVVPDRQSPRGDGSPHSASCPPGPPELQCVRITTLLKAECWSVVWMDPALCVFHLPRARAAVVNRAAGTWACR